MNEQYPLIDCTLECFDKQSSTWVNHCYACNYPMCEAHVKFIDVGRPRNVPVWCGAPVCEAVIRLDQLNPEDERLR